MSDDEIRQALRERLGTEPRFATDEAPASLDTLLWGINQTNALTARTRDDVHLLKRYAAHISADDLPPALRELPIGYDSTAEWLIVAVGRLVATTPRATAPTATDAEIRALIAEAMKRASRAPRRRPSYRFTYLHDETLDPAHEQVAADSHEHLSTQFGVAFIRDPEAIFDYVKADARAFRANWVVNQIERWRIERDHDALSRLFSAYSDRKARGKRWRDKQLRHIKSDQQLYCSFLRLVDGGMGRTDAMMKAFRSREKGDTGYVRAFEVVPYYDRALQDFALRPSTLSAAGERADAEQQRAHARAVFPQYLASLLQKLTKRLR